jgi:hypothetical protein
VEQDDRAGGEVSHHQVGDLGGGAPELVVGGIVGPEHVGVALLGNNLLNPVVVLAAGGAEEARGSAHDPGQDIPCPIQLAGDLAEGDLGEAVVVVGVVA